MPKMSITPYPLIISPPNNLLKKYMSIFGVLRYQAYTRSQRKIFIREGLKAKLNLVLKSFPR